MIGNAGNVCRLHCCAIFIVTSVLCIPSMSTLAADINPSPIAFPGKVKATTSPSGRYEVRIRRVWDQDGEPAYRLSLHDRRHKVRQDILTFDRSTVLKWRPNAEGFFLTNYAASNFTECLVAIPKAMGKTGDQIELRSMIEHIKRQPELSIPYNIENSHYYVVCGAWLGSSKVQVFVSGHRDEDAQNFSYKLTYDIDKDILEE